VVEIYGNEMSIRPSMGEENEEIQVKSRNGGVKWDKAEQQL